MYLKQNLYLSDINNIKSEERKSMAYLVATLVALITLSATVIITSSIAQNSEYKIGSSSERVDVPAYEYSVRTSSY